jgi:hypothetical protein
MGTIIRRGCEGCKGGKIRNSKFEWESIEARGSGAPGAKPFEFRISDFEFSAKRSSPYICIRRLTCVGNIPYNAFADTPRR